VSAEPLSRMTALEYLAFERDASETKHEFLDGEVIAMSGASLRHARLVRNLAFHLNARLRHGACEVLTQDLRVAASAAGPFFYPDVVAFCGKPELLDRDQDTLLNPRLVVEVLSASTERFDRGRKLFHYRSMASLVEIVLVAQERVAVERYRRDGEGAWHVQDFGAPEQSLELTSIGCSLTVGEIYEGVGPDPTG
jgi:Uma2 family endonuclease